MNNNFRIPKISDDTLETYQELYQNIVSRYNVDKMNKDMSLTKEALATEVMRLKEYRKEHNLHPLSVKQSLNIIATDQITGTTTQQRKAIKETISFGKKYTDFKEGETVFSRYKSIVYRAKNEPFYNEWKEKKKQEWKNSYKETRTESEYLRDIFYDEFIFPATRGDSK